MKEKLTQPDEHLSGEQVVEIIKSIVDDPKNYMPLNDRLSQALCLGDESPTLRAVAKSGYKDVIWPLRLQDGKPSPKEVEGSFKWANDRGRLHLKDQNNTSWFVQVVSPGAVEQVDLEVIYPNQPPDHSL